MTTLYIANCSKQTNSFIYRLPESNRTISQDIPPGKQVRIGSNLTSTDVDFIVRHHAKYGLVKEEEASKGKTFNGLCYSVDQPIKGRSLHAAFKHNDEVLRAQAEENRINTAATITAAIDGQLQETGSGASVGHLEMEILEETRPGQKPQVAAGVEVTPEGKQGRRGGRQRNR